MWSRNLKNEAALARDGLLRQLGGGGGSKEVVEKIKIHFTFNNFFPENLNVYEIMSKNVMETEGPQMTSEYGAYALHAGLARLHALMRMHTHIKK
jgi:hypothetical protein